MSADNTAVYAVHLLGAGADLGVRAAEAPAALRAFLAAEPDAQIAWLTGGHDRDWSAAPDRPLSPVASLLHAALDYGEVQRLLLVATSQTPPHASDTQPLAEVIESLYADGVDLFGYPLEDVQVLTLPRLDLADVARRMQSWAQAVEPGEVLLGSGGAVSAYLGLLLGLLDAGVRPSLLATDQQHRDLLHRGDLRGNELDVPVDTQRWLARAGYLDALAEVAEGEDTEPLRRLADALRLDWSGRQAPGTRRLVSLLTAGLLARCNRGDPSALFLLRPWITARYQARAELDDTAPATLAELPARHDAEVAHGGHCTVGGHHAAAGRHRSLGPLLHAAIGAPAQDGAVSDCSFTLEDGPARDVLAREGTLDLWKAGARADHGGNPSLRDVCGRVRSLTDADAVVTDGELEEVWRPVTGMGLPRPLLRGAAWLLLQVVGRRDVAEDGSTPMLDGVVAWAGSAMADCHLRLVTSDELSVTAERLAGKAEDQVGSVAALKVDPHHTSAALASLRNGLLDDGRLDGVSRVAVTAGPGTKPMNVAALLAAVQAGFAAMAPVEVLHLAPGAGGAVTVVRVARRTAVARLAHDAAVAELLPDAVARLDLPFAVDLLGRGSARWDQTRSRLASLDALTRARGMPRLQDRRDLLGNSAALEGGDAIVDARLWPTRLHLWQHLAEHDPWRVVYTVAAIAERCFGANAPAGTAWNRDWRAYGTAGHRVWQWRCNGPYGHGPAARPPHADVLRDTLRAAADEARVRARAVDEPLVPDRALTIAWRGLHRGLANAN